MIPKIGSIALVDGKLDAPLPDAPTVENEFGNNKRDSARDLKVDGCGDNDLDRFMPS